MATALPPIDESVLIPAAVRAAAARAEGFYKPQTPATPPISTEQPPEPPRSGNDSTPAPVQTPEPPAPAPTPDPTPAPTPDPASAADPRIAQLEADLAKQARDNQALKGRLAQQRDYIAMQQGQISQLSNPRSWAQPAREQLPQPPLISDEERKYYGDELLSVVERKAREVVRPAVQQLANANKALKDELAQVKSHDVYSELDRSLPGWEAINENQAWRDWLALPDLYSGVVRQRLLDGAFAAGDSGRILAFFRGFLAEHPEHSGQSSPAAAVAAPSSQTPPRKAAIKLETLVAPGRAQPSPPPAATADQPTITNKQIDRFYWEVTHGHWSGRDQQKAEREAAIHAAVREGRVRIEK